MPIKEYIVLPAISVGLCTIHIHSKIKDVFSRLIFIIADMAALGRHALWLAGGSDFNSL